MKHKIPNSETLGCAWVHTVHIPTVVLKTHYLENLPPRKMFHVEMNILHMSPVAQPVKTLTALHGSHKFITTFISSHHSALPTVTRSEPSPSHHISWKSISILQLAHQCLRFPSGLVPSKFPNIYSFMGCNMSCPYHPPWYGHPSDIPLTTKMITLLTVSFSFPLWQFSYFIPLRPKIFSSAPSSQTP